MALCSFHSKYSSKIRANYTNSETKSATRSRMSIMYCTLFQHAQTIWERGVGGFRSECHI